MSDDLMHDHIDDVARQMTAETPPDGEAFRRRVLARIDRGDAPRRTWRASFVLTPVAVAAAMVAAFFVAREHRPAPAGPRGLALQTANAGERWTDPVGPGVATVEAVTQPVRRPGPSRPAVHDPEPQPEPNDVASIAVAPLTIETISPDSIQLERLDSIAPIAVAPLDINDTSRRNQ
jgi:hypothetical protein